MINRYKKYISGLAMVAFMGLFAACSDPNEGSTFVTPSENLSELSIIDMLEGDEQHQFTQWLALLKKTNYYNALKSSASTATVFCPTNEAINAFLKEKNVSSIDELDAEYAKAIAQAHIIKGARYYEKAIDEYAKANQKLDETNLFSQNVVLSYGKQNLDVDDAERTYKYDTDTANIYLNNQARLAYLRTDTLRNGVFYVLNDVLQPLYETSDQVLKYDPTYTIFYQALEESGTKELAAKVSDNTGRRYSNTVFAVPDDVYKAAGINDVESLKSYLMSNNPDGETDANVALTHYMQYHILTSSYSTSQLFAFIDQSAGSKETVLVYPAYYEGQCIVTDNPKGTNAKGINEGTVNILRSDKQTRNGYIHKVDGVMPVFHPSQCVYNWDFLNYPDMIAQVNTWGERVWGRPTFFSDPLEASPYKYDFSGNIVYKDKDTQEQLPYVQPENFTFKTTDFGNTGTYPPIGYIKDQAGSSGYSSYGGNYLCLNIGNGGYIEFTTPSIIPGRYSIILHYISVPANDRDYYTTGTEVQFTLDGEQYTAYLLKGSYSTRTKYYSLTEQLYGNYKFDTAGRHTFRIKFNDTRASTKSGYHLFLDYVEFAPVN